MIRILAGGLALLLTATVGARQAPPSVYDLSLMPMMEVNPNIRVKKVMGAIGTLMFGEFKAGWKNTPHHHTHEQVHIGLSGTYNSVTSSKAHPISRMRGLLMPADVQHGNDASSATANPLLFEFQPVRRIDFPPEREQTTFPAAAVPVPPPVEQQGFDFTSESAGWERLSNGARVKTSTGKTVAIAAWQVPAAATTAFDLRLHVPGAEQFVYVLEGAVHIRTASERIDAKEGMVVVNAPNSRPLQVRSSGSRPATLLTFEAAKLP